jgi:hypothetical protein
MIIGTGTPVGKIIRKILRNTESSMLDTRMEKVRIRMKVRKPKLLQSWYDISD